MERYKLVCLGLRDFSKLICERDRLRQFRECLRRGEFADAGGSLIRYIAKWDGSAWSALGSGIMGQVNSLVFDRFGNLYAGGAIYSADEQAVNSIAQWNGTNWSPLGSGLNGDVKSLALDGLGNLYVGGHFTMAGGENATNIAKWNGSTWSAVGSEWNGVVETLAIDSSGNLYAGGTFTLAGGIEVSNIAEWNGTNWSAVGSGMSGQCNSLAFDSFGDLYAGGTFSSVAGFGNYINIAKWNGSDWSTFGIGNVNIDIYGGNPQVSSLLFDHSGNLYAGGNFTIENGTNASYIAKYRGTNWSPINSGLLNEGIPFINAFAFDGSGNLYAGGQFQTAGGANASNIAKWNGSTWSGLGVGTKSFIQALACDSSGNLYASGGFRIIGGIAANEIAKWDGADLVPPRHRVDWRS